VDLSRRALIAIAVKAGIFMMKRRQSESQ